MQALHSPTLLTFSRYSLLLWNLKPHYRLQKRSSLGPVFNASHTLQAQCLWSPLYQGRLLLRFLSRFFVFSDQQFAQWTFDIREMGLWVFNYTRFINEPVFQFRSSFRLWQLTAAANRFVLSQRLFYAVVGPRILSNAQDDKTPQSCRSRNRRLALPIAS